MPKNNIVSKNENILCLAELAFGEAQCLFFVYNESDKPLGNDAFDCGSLYWAVD